MNEKLPNKGAFLSVISGHQVGLKPLEGFMGSKYSNLSQINLDRAFGGRRCQASSFEDGDELWLLLGNFCEFGNLLDLFKRLNFDQVFMRFAIKHSDGRETHVIA